jgi:hypothetical protein
MKIYPIGYSTPGARERIDELLESPKTLLIDTRITPWSWNDEWKGEALKARYGEKYRYAGKFLGNTAKDLGLIRIADIETGLRGLMTYLYEGYDLILLCQCKKFNNCHVSTIVDDLLDRYIVEVVHFGEQVQWTQR